MAARFLDCLAEILRRSATLRWAEKYLESDSPNLAVMCLHNSVKYNYMRGNAPLSRRNPRDIFSDGRAFLSSRGTILFCLTLIHINHERCARGHNRRRRQRWMG